MGIHIYGIQNGIFNVLSENISFSAPHSGQRCEGKPRSGRPDRLDPRIEARILAKTHERPPAPRVSYVSRPSGWLVGSVFIDDNSTVQSPKAE